VSNGLERDRRARIAHVVAAALVFECVPALSGRVGDVLYFFAWSVRGRRPLEPGPVDA